MQFQINSKMVLDRSDPMYPFEFYFIFVLITHKVDQDNVEAHKIDKGAVRDESTNVSEPTN